MSDLLNLKLKTESNKFIFKIHISLFISLNLFLIGLNFLIISLFSFLIYQIILIGWLVGLIIHGILNLKRNSNLSPKKKTTEPLQIEPQSKIKNKERKRANDQAIRKLSLEEIKELRKTEKEIEIEENKIICIVHKGAIDGANIYICPICKSFYCGKCAKALSDRNEKCWACDKEININ